jgi:hypothetical protein
MGWARLRGPRRRGAGDLFMTKNFLECLPGLTEQQLDYVIIALARLRSDYRALPREQLKRERVARLGLLSRKEIRNALLEAEAEGHVPVGTASTILPCAKE